MPKSFFVNLSLLVIFFGMSCLSIDAPTQATIVLDPAIKYQTIIGWEAESQSGEYECQGFNNYSNTLFDLAVNDLGINRVRLEIKSGVENPVDYFTQYIQGKITRDEWKTHWYEIINDNSNPNVIDSNRFKFSELDDKIEKVVNPLRNRLAARGEKLFVNVNYVDFASSDFEHKDFPQEYAEFVQATYQHIMAKYGWAPDAWEVVLEPDNASWSAEQIGNVIAAAATRLQSLGYQPYFIAPSTTHMGHAVSYFQTIIQVPGVQPYLKELSYHRYSGVSEANLQAIADLSIQYDVDTAMLEHIGSGYEDLHQDLEVGLNSAWQQYTLGYCSGDDGSAYYWIDDSNPAKPVVNLGSLTRFLRQYFKFIRNGAVRIKATSSNADFDPLAFINKDGGYVVVVKANQEGVFTVSGLPAGGYGIKYTTDVSYNVDLKDVVLPAGQGLTTRIPDRGVLTIYPKPNAAQTVYHYVPVLGK